MLRTDPYLIVCCLDRSGTCIDRPAIDCRIRSLPRASSHTNNQVRRILMGLTVRRRVIDRLARIRHDHHQHRLCLQHKIWKDTPSLFSFSSRLRSPRRSPLATRRPRLSPPPSLESFPALIFSSPPPPYCRLYPGSRAYIYHAIPKEPPGIWDVWDPGLRYAQKWGSRGRDKKAGRNGHRRADRSDARSWPFAVRAPTVPIVVGIRRQEG